MKWLDYDNYMTNGIFLPNNMEGKIKLSERTSRMIMVLPDDPDNGDPARRDPRRGELPMR